MFKAGFIGYGSMGSMLMNGFLASGGLAPREVVVSTRTKAKLEAVLERWPGVTAAFCNADAAQARHLFLCIKPADVRAILDEIRPALIPGTHIVSIAGPVPLASIGGLTGCAVTKVVPTVASEVSGGVTLVCHGPGVLPEDAAFVEGLLRPLAWIKHLPETDLGMGAELTSCMPGFISSIFQELVESALRHTTAMNRAVVEELVLQTLLGTAMLMAEKNMGFEETIARVATKGGITEEGVKTFRARLPQVFDEMFDRTLEKRRLVEKNIRNTF